MPALRKLASSLAFCFLSLCPHDPVLPPQGAGLHPGCFAVSEAGASEDWLHTALLGSLGPTDMSVGPDLGRCTRSTRDAGPGNPHLERVPRGTDDVAVACVWKTLLEIVC